MEASGKVRAFGVSNQTPGQIELLRRYVEQPLVANQLQLSITHASLVAQGVASNMADLDQSISRDNGIVDYCRLNDITVQAWSPFQAGFFTGVFLGSPDYPELNAAIDRLAAVYDVPPPSGWHPGGPGHHVPVPGRRRRALFRHPVDPSRVVRTVPGGRTPGAVS